FRYLVVEWTTMSNPCSSGRCTHGEANVLSHTPMSFLRWAISATAERSTTFSSGFVGVSTQSMRVLGRIACSRLDTSERSTNEACRPADLFLTFSQMRELP